MSYSFFPSFIALTQFSRLKESWHIILISKNCFRQYCLLKKFFGETYDIPEIAHKKNWTKKAFTRVINGFYLICAFNFQKNSTVPFKSWKKISSKLSMQGIKRSGILRWFQKCVELLRQEVPKDFFSEKQFFCKIFQVPKNSAFL